MVDKALEDDDPMELVGVTMPRAGDPAAVESMAQTFVEEYLRMGWPREEILAVFQDPFFRGPYSIYRSRGLDYVCSLLDQATRIPPAAR